MKTFKSCGNDFWEFNGFTTLGDVIRSVTGISKKHFFKLLYKEKIRVNNITEYEDRQFDKYGYYIIDIGTFFARRIVIFFTPEVH